MKSLVLRTDTQIPRAIEAKRIYWVGPGKHGLEVKSKLVLNVAPPSLGAMLHEIEDGADEADVLLAIQAAALAGDWHLAESIAQRYSLVVCLRCTAAMQQRPGQRLVNLIEIENCWGEVCGSCAVKLLEEADA